MRTSKPSRRAKAETDEPLEHDHIKCIALKGMAVNPRADSRRRIASSADFPEPSGQGGGRMGAADQGDGEGFYNSFDLNRMSAGESGGGDQRTVASSKSYSLLCEGLNPMIGAGMPTSYIAVRPGRPAGSMPE